MWFDAPPLADLCETRRARNRRWRREMARYRLSHHGCWTPIEVIWAKRLETLLEEARHRPTEHIDGKSS